MSLEVELKLAIAPGDVARLRRHPLLKGLKSRRHQLYSIYFDTPDFVLYRQKGAFRLRREGFHWVQTVKLDRGSVGGLSARPEYETQVAGNQPDFGILPDEVRGVLTEAVTAQLEPRFVTDFQRTTWLISRPQGEVELALDLGHVRAGERDMPVAEIELELKSGENGLLFELAEALLDGVPLLPEYRSKALRGYQLAGVWQDKPCKAIPAAIERGMPAAEAWRLMLQAGLIQLERNVPGMLTGDDPEYLHQMRVAVRRMRTVLSLGRRIDVAPEGWTEALRWFMAELSPARDWDVMVTETLAAARTGLPNAERLDGLLAAASARRAAADARARAALRDPRFALLVLDISRGLSNPLHSGPKLAGWCRDSLDRRLKRFRALASAYDELDAAGRHQLRIAAKRLRYAGEAFAPLYGEAATTYLAQVAKLQDGLGAANDIAVAHGLLAELLAKDKRLALAAGLVEGYMAGASAGRIRQAGELAVAVATQRPFWRKAD